MQRRIQGAFFDAQDLVAPLMDVFRDVVAVHFSVGQSFQDEHVECVAQQIARFGLFLSHCKESLPIRFLGEYLAIGLPFQAYFLAGGRPTSRVVANSVDPDNAVIGQFRTGLQLARPQPPCDRGPALSRSVRTGPYWTFTASAITSAAT